MTCASDSSEARGSTGSSWARGTPSTLIVSWLLRMISSRRKMSNASSSTADSGSAVKRITELGLLVGSGSRAVFGLV